MPDFIAQRISRAAGEDKNCVIGILGLSFKPGSDDVRDAPSARIIKALNAMGYKNIVAYDPVAIDEFKNHYAELSLECVSSYKQCIESAQLLVIATA